MKIEAKNLEESVLSYLNNRGPRTLRESGAVANGLHSIKHEIYEGHLFTLIRFEDNHWVDHECWFYGSFTDFFEAVALEV